MPRCSLCGTVVLQVLSLPPGARAVLANGRMLGTLRPSEKFVQEDLGLLEKYFQSTLGEKITEVLEGEGEDHVASLHLFTLISVNHNI